MQGCLPYLPFNFVPCILLSFQENLPLCAFDCNSNSTITSKVSRPSNRRNKYIKFYVPFNLWEFSHDMVYFGDKY